MLITIIVIITIITTVVIQIMTVITTLPSSAEPRPLHPHHHHPTLTELSGLVSEMEEFGGNWDSSQSGSKSLVRAQWLSSTDDEVN